MLLRFEVGNHRSIMQAVTLSMIAVDEDRPATRGFDLLSERVLTVAGVYGANASGKTNIINALAWLSAAVAESLVAWGEGIPREPFKFAGDLVTPSTFEIEMIVEGVRYAYAAEFDDSNVLFERLHSYPERRPRLLFEREGHELHLRRGLTGSAGVRELLTPTTLALSWAVRFNVPGAAEFGRALSDIGVLGPWSRVQRSLKFRDLLRISETATDTLFGERNEPDPDRQAALGLLRFADLGIDEVEVAEEQTAEGDRRRIRLVHSIGGRKTPFERNEESLGTRTWYELIGPALHALRRGQPMLLDEIDASLHPRLSARLVDLFKDPGTNPKDAQLIFTSHDTSLLNHLNRDEVWLTEKGEDGATRLTALAEYGGDKVRQSLNLERAYLQGRFGAVPEFDQTRLRAALAKGAELADG